MSLAQRRQLVDREHWSLSIARGFVCFRGMPSSGPCA